MGSCYEGKKVKADEDDESDWMEGICGYLSEETIREVMIETGLLEEDDKGLAKVGKQQPQPKVDKVEDEKINVVRAFGECSWGAFEEEPVMGWIWYPYTHEELMSFQEEEDVWEHSLWNWKDFNGIGIPNP